MNLKSKLSKIRLSASLQFVILSVLVLLYISYFTFVSFEKHNNFFTGRFDLGNMDQTVWNTKNGRIFTLTNSDGTNIISRLSAHADFILILLAPFYFIWEDPRMLLIVQTIVIAIGSVFVYLLSIHILNNKFQINSKFKNFKTNIVSSESKNLALAFSLSYLLNPFIQKQNLYDFHAVSLATTFLLAAFYFLLKKQTPLFLFFLFLAVLCKENIYLIAAIFGIYLIFKKKIRLGFILTILSLVIFFLLVTKFIPEARGGDHFALEYYSAFGNSSIEIVKNILLNPLKTIFTIYEKGGLSYLSTLLLPVGFLSVLSPQYLIFSIPDLLKNTLSANASLRSINFHYGAEIVPFIYISAIYGVRNLERITSKFLPRQLAVLYVLAFSAVATYQFGVLPGSKRPSLEIYNSRVENRNEIGKILSSIPEHAKVAATNNLGAHLSHREYIYTIPYGIAEAEYVVFLLNDPYAQPSLSAQKKMAENLKKDSRYALVYEKGEFVMFRRK